MTETSGEHSPQIQTYSLTATDNTNIPFELSELTGMSQTRIKTAMSCGAVWRKHNDSLQRIRRANVKVAPGDEIIFHFNANALAAKSFVPELIANETDFSVWCKPSGMTVSGSRYADHTSLKRWVEVNQRSGNTVFIVHRLDRFTLGLIVVAHNKNTAADLSRQFRERSVSKRYHAICHGKWKSVWGNAQTITTPIDGKSATTHIQRLDGNEEFSLLEISIDTGRRHQIRRHLAEQGYPVVGDRLYGKASPTDESAQKPDLDLQLRATGLAFQSPTGDRLNFELDGDRWPQLADQQ